MAEVLRSPAHFPSSPERPNDGSSGLLSHSDGFEVGTEEGRRGGGRSIEGKREARRKGEGREEEEEELQQQERRQQQQLSVLALLLTVFRKSLLGCKTEDGADDEDSGSMEIGCPTDVRHVAHVTFDRFHGFLGLPVEFEPEVPRRAPSASATVFGVSTESMQCSFDSRGNSVPTILLLLQRRLYEQGGLEAEGIFRINAENSQEEFVRDRLNNGVVPEGIDVHCLAGLIKAWFRELPSGLLDSLSYEQVMQCQTEEDCSHLASLLQPSDAALLDWAVNLMADVVREEQRNKMNARNIATVFAPNMTQMSDPLTALMYAVQVMNFLRMLILKTLKERQESISEDATLSNADTSDENGHHSPRLHLEPCSEGLAEQVYVNNEPVSDGSTRVPEEKPANEDEAASPQASHENAVAADSSPSISTGLAASSSNAVRLSNDWTKTVRSNTRNNQKGRKVKAQATSRASWPSEKSKGRSLASRMNSKVERIESWR